MVPKVVPGGDGVVPEGDGVVPGGDTVVPGGDTVVPGGDIVVPGGDTVVPGGPKVEKKTQCASSLNFLSTSVYISMYAYLYVCKHACL